MVNIWERLHRDREKNKLRSLVIAAVCRNIWRERNFRIFTNTARSHEGCASHAHSDILFWTYLLFNKERVCLSNDNSFDDMLSPQAAMTVLGEIRQHEGFVSFGVVCWDLAWAWASGCGLVCVFCVYWMQFVSSLNCSFCFPPSFVHGLISGDLLYFVL